LEKLADSYYNELINQNECTEVSISDIGTVVGGSTPSKSHKEYYSDNGIAWITPKDLATFDFKFISHGNNDISNLGLRNSSCKIMPEGTVLFSSRAPIGYIAIASNEVTTNQGFKSVIPNDDIGTAFVYYCLKNNISNIENYASGSTFKEVSASVMKEIKVKLPSKENLLKFSALVDCILVKQKKLEDENASFKKLRDILLPRLMNGEIDLSRIIL